MNRAAQATPAVKRSSKVNIQIPFNKPFLTGNEFTYISEAISLQHTAGDGSFTQKCSELLERLLGAPRVMLTTSCTDALEMAAILLDLHDGDEVIVPSFTFVSTANAFAMHRARPVFADVRPDTLNIDERTIESLITPRTRAIVVVHYAGVACEMDTIREIAERRGLVLIEDNAHGLFGRYRGKMLGTLGSLATQSFHETKNIICGEGGALVVNDLSYVERAEVIREKGTNRSRFFRGQVDKYTWVDIGSSFLPSDILAAFLYAQLMARARIQSARKRIWERYESALKPWAERSGVRLPHVPEGCEQPYHMFYLVMQSLDARTAFIERLRDSGIAAVFHYQPLHLSEMGVKFGGRVGACPVTEDISDRLVRLPLYNGMTSDEQDEVIDRICEFLP
jgi:dTDP-4-amino-4,6-dideoxygalactose transaminase